MNINIAYDIIKKAFSELQSERINTTMYEQSQTVYELLVYILTAWVDKLRREGLYKEYIEIEDVQTNEIKGRLNISKTMSALKSKNKLVCSITKMSVDNTINRVIKATLKSTRINDITNKAITNKLRDQIDKLSSISDINIKRIEWARIRFNNNNIRYKEVTELCRLILEYNDDTLECILTKYIKDNIDEWIKQYINDNSTLGIYRVSGDRVIVYKNKNIHLVITKSNDELCEYIKGIQSTDKSIIVEIRINSSLYIEYNEFLAEIVEGKKVYREIVNLYDMMGYTDARIEKAKSVVKDEILRT